jgi:site-specific recombinase XerD
VPTLPDYLVGFESDLVARNRAPQTVTTYLKAAHQFIAWLEDQGHSTEANEVSANDVRGWLGHLHSRVAPATVAQRFRSLQQFMNFVVSEGDSGLAASPMARLKPPSVPEKPIPILSAADLGALRRTCTSTDFESRRDAAILELFIDTGARLGEIADARLEDLDTRAKRLLVVVKGRHTREKTFSDHAVKVLERYLRARKSHPNADSDFLWVGKRGRLKSQGVRRVLERRAREAGLDHIHPHQFRHTFAHRFLMAGGNDSELMTLMGWRSRAMLDRYGAVAATERAIDSYQRLSRAGRL